MALTRARLASFPLIVCESGCTGRSPIDESLGREGPKADLVQGALVSPPGEHVAH